MWFLYHKLMNLSYGCDPSNHTVQETPGNQKYDGEFLIKYHQAWLHDKNPVDGRDLLGLFAFPLFSYCAAL